MTQKAILVGIDGAQLEKLLLLGLQEEVEALLGLDIVESYVGGEVGSETEQATSSGPGWSTILTGTWVDQHGVESNNNAPVEGGVDSIFERIDAAIPDANIASVVHWAPINNGHFSREAGLLEDEAVIDEVVSGISDQAVTDTVVDLILDEAPDFTFVHLDDVDGAGHGYGFGEEYNDALATAMAQLQAIKDAVDQRMAENPGEDWLILVTTDHGRDPLTGSGHGGQTDSERRTFIAANKELEEFDEAVPATSVVTTILDHLGIDFELSEDGLVSGSLLEGAADPLVPTLEDILLPEDDAGNVSVGTDISIRFSENIQAGSGNIVIKQLSDDAIVATIDVTSAAVTVNGDTVTVDLPEDLAYETQYYVEIDSGAFTDGTNDFYGLSGSTAWNFTTEADTVAPEAVSFGPADDAAAVPADGNLTIEFNEPIVAGNGNIVIYRASDDSVVESIDVTSDQVTIDGKTVTIDPSADLEPGTAYYVQVDAGALRDTASLTTLFSENFEGLTLDPFVNETGGDGTDFTAEAPEGWTHDNTTPGGGVTEFFGWTFMDKSSWVNAAADQGRSGFVNGSGTVMVADPDEYDDGAVGIDPNLFNAYMRTPAIDISTVAAGSLTLTFDSSWRYEDSQKAVLTVSYDGGESVEVLRFSSDPSDPDFKEDATNETLTINLDNPEGASNVVISFGVIEAGNDWWWAIDNILVQGQSDGGATSGNPYAGISDSTTWNFTTEGPDSGGEQPGEDDGLLLEGTRGNDFLLGYGGDDTLLGDRGDDTLDGGDGDDSLDGGRDDDVILGGEGFDTISGDRGEDSVLAGEGDDWVDGGRDDDLLFGSDGDDTLIGDRGDDSLDGGDGDDVIDAGRGDDYVAGGDGDDLILADRGDDEVDGGDGDDTIDGGRDDDYLDGGNDDDLLLGDRGDDTLVGDGGDDTLDGGYDDDSLDGGAGDDLLLGGRDDDTLAGGEGDDTLTGGHGDDLFVFDAGTGFDVVTDFEPGDDMIALNGFSFTDFTALISLAVNDGGDVVFSLDAVAGDELRLVGVQTDDLSDDDFLFNVA
ncbi:Ig-like domain-containing protein [Pelagibius sp. 7325]|uniref:Ig-like domain-containing protein n=1 Tax=Pelagibius sp. 7325 TaxID=3131994 RepID=UPI0030EEA442